jgi:hypothetical protein
MITPPHLYFGALAVQNGYASSSEIDLALEAQKEGATSEHESPLKLGEILQDMGTLTSTQVRSVLETQTRLKNGENGPAAPVAGPMALIQEAGPSLTVNGEVLAAPRTLKAGDRIQLGELLLRFTADPEAAIELRPKEASPAAETLPQPAGIPAIAPAAVPPPPVATVPKPGLAEKFLPILRKVDGVIARIPPALLHTQRKYVLAGATLSWMALILPWRSAANGNTILGVSGPGWLPALLTLVPVALTLFTRAGDPFTKTERIASSAAAALGLAIGIWKFALPPANATGRGIGLYVSLLATACVLAAGAFARAGSGSTIVSTPLGGRLLKTILRFAGNLSGRRAKELALAIEQRDGLLRELGEAALVAHPTLPEAAAALQSRDAVQKAEKETSEPSAPNAQVRAKAAQKSADAKAKRAFGKLAQRVLDGGLPLEGQEAAIAELGTLEARIKELS